MSNFWKYRMPYFKKHQKTSPTHFFKGVIHEQHWSSIVCLLGVLYCVQLVFDAFFFPKILLSFPFPFLCYFFFSFYFLSSILLDFSKCLIFQNIGGLMKTPLKTTLKHVFMAVAYEQPWSSTVCLLWGPLLCPAFLFFYKISFSFPLL